MKYEIALSIASKAIQKLTDEEGNLSEAELVLHVAALDLATRNIAKRNGVVLPC